MARLNVINSATFVGNNQAWSDATEWGCTGAATVSHVRCRRTAAQPLPSWLYLYDGESATAVVSSRCDNLTWTQPFQDCWQLDLAANGLATPTFAAGFHHCLTFYWETSLSKRYYHNTAPVTEDAGLIHYGFRTANSATPYPPVSFNPDPYHVAQDIVATVQGATPGEPDPDPGGATFGELAIWLQNGNPNLRADSLAKLIYDYLQGMQTVIDQIDASTVNLPPLLSTLTSAWLQARQADIAAILAEVDNLQAHIVGASGGGGSAFYGPNGTQVAAGVEQLLAAGAPLSWADGAVLAEAAHSLADSFPFQGQVGWGSGYALHRVHFDNSDARHPPIDLGAAGTWVPGIGWWAAVLPDGSLTNRTPCEFQDQWLWPVPSAAVGVVLWVHPSVAGTLYAYAVPAAGP